MDKNIWWSFPCYGEIDDNSFPGLQQEFYYDNRSDVIEQDALNEQSCIQVLRIMNTTADNDIKKLEEDLFQLAWADDENWCDMCCNVLREKINRLDISFQNLKDEIHNCHNIDCFKDRKPAESTQKIISDLLIIWCQRRNAQTAAAVGDSFNSTSSLGLAADHTLEKKLLNESDAGNTEFDNAEERAFAPEDKCISIDSCSNPGETRKNNMAREVQSDSCFATKETVDHSVEGGKIQDPANKQIVVAIKPKRVHLNTITFANSSSQATKRSNMNLRPSSSSTKPFQIVKYKGASSVDSQQQLMGSNQRTRIAKAHSFSSKDGDATPSTALPAMKEQLGFQSQSRITKKGIDVPSSGIRYLDRAAKNKSSLRITEERNPRYERLLKEKMPELRRIAKALHVPGAWNMRKEVIVEAIVQAEEHRATLRQCSSEQKKAVSLVRRDHS